MENKKSGICKKGFTLIELLVVVAIISLLSSVAFASLTAARKKAQDARRLEDKNSMITALNSYYAENGSWPLSEGGGTSLNCLAPSSELCSLGPGFSATGIAGSDMLVNSLTPYVSAIPKVGINDPYSGSPINRILFGAKVNNFTGSQGSLCTAGRPTCVVIKWFAETAAAGNSCPIRPIAPGITNLEQNGGVWGCSQVLE